MQILDAIKVKVEMLKSEQKGCLFVGGKLIGQVVKALIDNSASNGFQEVKKTDILGIPHKKIEQE